MFALADISPVRHGHAKGGKRIKTLLRTYGALFLPLRVVMRETKTFFALAVKFFLATMSARFSPPLLFSCADMGPPEPLSLLDNVEPTGRGTLERLPVNLR